MIANYPRIYNCIIHGAVVIYGCVEQCEECEKDEYRKDFEDMCWSGENGLGPQDLDDE